MTGVLYGRGRVESGTIDEKREGPDEKGSRRVSTKLEWTTWKLVDGTLLRYILPGEG